MQDKATLTVKEAADVAGVSLPTMYAITKREDFKALIRIGRKQLVLKSKFLEWLEQQAGKEMS